MTLRVMIGGEEVEIDTGDKEQVKRFAEAYHLKKARFYRPARLKKREKKCIACGLCERTCSAGVGARALKVYKKNDKSHEPGSFMEGPDACIGCGSCAAVCPTRCIELVDKGTTRSIWGQQFELTACTACGAPLFTARHRAWVVGSSNLSEDYFTTCAVCNRQKMAQRFSEIGRPDDGGGRDA